MKTIDQLRRARSDRAAARRVRDTRRQQWHRILNSEELAAVERATARMAQVCTCAPTGPAVPCPAHSPVCEHGCDGPAELVGDQILCPAHAEEP